MRVDLDRPLRPVAVEPRYDEVLLVVFARGRAVGEVRLPALSTVAVDLQEAAIARQLGRSLWRSELRERFLAAVGATPADEPAQPGVSVVVCTRERPDELERCLAGLLSLAPPPVEVIVVDNAPETDGTRDVCSRYPLRYVVEPIAGQARARNRGIVESTGELVAFTDDDCVVEPGWLAGLAADFADPRVLAVTGSVAPLELETLAQAMFEAHGGFGRGFERRLFDGTKVEPTTAAGRAGAGANAIFRRRAFDEVGLFAEWLGPGTPARAADDNDMFCRILAAGFSIVYEPARLVWHRHRSDDQALRGILHDYAVSSTAFATQRLRADLDPAGRAIFRWWWLDHLPREVAASLLRRSPLPFRAILAEALGSLRGPARYLASRRSRRGIPPVELPPARPQPASAVRVVAAEPPRVSVVVPTAGGAPTLGRVLEGLARQDYPKDRFEAVVVLDGEAEGPAGTSELPFAVRVVARAKAGVAAARNAGVQAASHPIVHFLDDDIVPEPPCLATHAAAHAGSPAQLVVLGYCPPVVDASWWGQALRAWWEDHYRRKGEPAHRWSYVDFTTGNSSLPRELLLAAGGFDEAFGERHEDWELAVRLLARRVPFAYHPETRAWHHLDVSLAAAVAHQRREGEADVLIARRHPAIGAELPLARHHIRRGRGSRRFERRLERAGWLESRGMRAVWRSHVAALLGDAYAAGLRDAIPSDGAFEQLLAELRSRGPQRVELALDGGQPPELPAVGALELVLLLNGKACARVAPGPLGEPWDWPAVAERVCREAAPAVRAAVVGRELARRASAPALAPAEPEIAHVG